MLEASGFLPSEPARAHLIPEFTLTGPAQCPVLRSNQRAIKALLIGRVGVGHEKRVGRRAVGGEKRSPVAGTYIGGQLNRVVLAGDAGEPYLELVVDPVRRTENGNGLGIDEKTKGFGLWRETRVGRLHDEVEA